MFNVLMGFFIDREKKREKLETLKKLRDANNTFSSKVMGLFILMFAFNFFILSLAFTFALSFFGFFEGEHQHPLLIVAAVATLLLSFVFFNIMKKTWRKLRKPIEKELELEL